MSLLSAAAADEDGDIIQALRAENDALKTKLMAATKSALDHVQRNRDLEALLEAVGAGGVGPLMPRKLTQQDIADGALLGNIESPFNACMHQEHCKRWKAQADQQHQRKLSNDNDLQRENGQLITSSSTAPAGWKLVPVEPTEDMTISASSRCVIAIGDGADYIRGQEAAEVFHAMLAAAPQPPAVEQPQGSRAMTDSSRDAQEAPFEAWREKHGQYLKAGGGQYEKTFAWHAWCEAAKKAQPQGEQEPVAWIENLVGALSYNPHHEAARKLPEGVRFDLYTRPQPSESAYLLRDLAADIGVNAMDLIAAIRDAGMGDYSINMKLPTRVVVAMCQKFAVAPPRQPLTDEQIDAVWGATKGPRHGIHRFARAIERAHGIGGEA